MLLMCHPCSWAGQCLYKHLCAGRVAPAHAAIAGPSTNPDQADNGAAPADAADATATVRCLLTLQGVRRCFVWLLDQIAQVIP